MPNTVRAWLEAVKPSLGTFLLWLEGSEAQALKPWLSFDFDTLAEFISDPHYFQLMTAFGAPAMRPVPSPRLEQRTALPDRASTMPKCDARYPTAYWQALGASSQSQKLLEPHVRLGRAGALDVLFGLLALSQTNLKHLTNFDAIGTGRSARVEVGRDERAEARAVQRARTPHEHRARAGGRRRGSYRAGSGALRQNVRALTAPDPASAIQEPCTVRAHLGAHLRRSSHTDAHAPALVSSQHTEEEEVRTRKWKATVVRPTTKLIVKLLEPKVAVARALLTSSPFGAARERSRVTGTGRSVRECVRAGVAAAPGEGECANGGDGRDAGKAPESDASAALHTSPPPRGARVGGGVQEVPGDWVATWERVKLELQREVERGVGLPTGDPDTVVDHGGDTVLDGSTPLARAVTCAAAIVNVTSRASVSTAPKQHNTAARHITRLLLAPSRRADVQALGHRGHHNQNLRARHLNSDGGLSSES
ncbi:hypothetical protein GGX14DRAFT_395918 [Mycena pura]|uniref:Uncharacterized protein n=1 Tax=Mycena pura TaxID=153505 RepID=A0AAD6VDK3_9AGAR|nr:hypothetical protein GGX14DRAFT_395918 [Mycena pura]